MNNLLPPFLGMTKMQDTISENEYKMIQPYIELLMTLSQSYNINLYIIDYYKHDFLYISPTPLILNGLNFEDIKNLGYDYYQKFIPESDLNTLKEVNQIICDFLTKQPKEDRSKYTFSYNFHLVNERKSQILVHQKFTPLALSANGNIWLGLYILSLSSRSSLKEVLAIEKDTQQEYEYLWSVRRWKQRERITLSTCDRDILRLSALGYSNKEIGERICMDVNTVKAHKKSLFAMMKVNSIAEAIGYSLNHRLI